MQPPQKTGLTSLQIIGIAWVLVIGLLVSCIAIGTIAFSRMPHSHTSAPVTLSNAPVTACDTVYDKTMPTAPGTLTAEVNGQRVTHFLAGQPFQLIYQGDTGDTFAPGTMEVDALPYFDGSIQQNDNNTTRIAISQQDIAGSKLALPVTFPFPNDPVGTGYTRPGPYCFAVLVAYVRPDGLSDIGAAFIGLVEDSAPSA